MKITFTLLFILIIEKSIHSLCSDKCKTCNNYGVCLECNNEYVLSIDNECIEKQKCNNCKKCDKKFQCIECDEGYELKDYKCIERTCSNCINCSLGKCAKCFDEFILVNGKCFSNRN